MKSKLLLVFTMLFSNVVLGAPLVKILVEPCSFTGKTITTSGILAFPSPLIEPGKARLFLTEADFKYNNFEQSIIVPFSSDFHAKRDSYSLKYINIEGVFDCTISSHGITGAGGFRSVSKLILAASNPNYPD